MTLTVNGDSLAASESITVGSNPDLTLSVSVNGSEELTTVCVTVDNKTRRVYDNSTLNQILMRKLGITLSNGVHIIDIKTTTQRGSRVDEETRRNNTSTETALKHQQTILLIIRTPTSPPTGEVNETQNASIQTYTDRFTVVVDTAAPFVEYTSLFESTAAAPPPDRPTVTNSTVMLAGTFQDRSAVTAVQITHVYEYDFAGRSQSTRSTY